ncbi:MAG: hypothetical protein WA215_02280 [Candidatus Cybelea sp.]
MNDRNFRLDFFIAIAAVLISALTAGTLFYQTRVIGDEFAATIWPYLSVGTTYDTGGRRSKSPTTESVPHWSGRLNSTSTAGRSTLGTTTSKQCRAILSYEDCFYARRLPSEPDRPATLRLR